MGLPATLSDAGEAQEQADQELEPDWYQLYCQAIAAGIDPREFGDYTYSQTVAAIDAHKLRRYNDMYFNVSGIVSQMDDDGVRDAYHEKSGGNTLRGKLVEKMMIPYAPSFLQPDWQRVRSAYAAKPIEGLEPRVAEGIMQAIENKIVTHDQWIAIHPLWDRILATAQTLRT